MQAGSLVKRASNGMSGDFGSSLVSAVYFLRDLQPITSSLGQVFTWTRKGTILLS